MFYFFSFVMKLINCFCFRLFNDNYAHAIYDITRKKSEISVFDMFVNFIICVSMVPFLLSRLITL